MNLRNDYLESIRITSRPDSSPDNINLKTRRGIREELCSLDFVLNIEIERPRRENLCECQNVLDVLRLILNSLSE